MASCGVRSMKCAEEDVKFMPSCGVLKKHFYIGADGMVAPCMGMCDCTFAGNFPNLFETPLKDILRDSIYTELYAATVGDVRNRNPRVSRMHRRLPQQRPDFMRRLLRNRP